MIVRESENVNQDSQDMNQDGQDVKDIQDIQDMTGYDRLIMDILYIMDILIQITV